MDKKMKSPDDFSYQSRFIEVLGAKIHYIDEGEGDPLLFLHGIPTSNYLWRNVIPHLMPYGRCIAPDLIGLGKSDKPKLKYCIFDYIRYVDAFIKALGLKRITLVLHAWGSVIGFHYAMKHSDNIKGLAFLEAYLRPELKDSVSLSAHQLHSLLQSPQKTFQTIVDSDQVVDQLLSSGSLRKLNEKELSYYREPFKTAEDRKLLWQYLQDLPLGDQPNDVTDVIRDYSEKLMESDIPMLMLYGIPGFQMTMDTVSWAKSHLKKLKLVDIGEMLHYAPESNPDGVGKAIVDWYQTIDD